ncbi:MAG: urease accessory protein UreD [Novosphingobium sp.]
MYRSPASSASMEAGCTPQALGPRAATVPPSLRSSGRIDLSLAMRGNELTLPRAFQSGCLRVRLPRAAGDGERRAAVILNTAGGIADGDRLDQRIDWQEQAIGAVTTQAAEKIYRALANGSTIETRLNVGRGASAEWLPQETILFDGARLDRETRVVLADDVTFLGIEALVLGRAAMGETVRSGALRDRLRIWRNERLIYADALNLDGDIAALMQRSAIGAGARAMAVLVHASAGAAALVGPLREALETARGRAAASSWNGLLAVRLLAPDGETLRHDIAAALGVLCNGRPLPRVWRC